MSVFDDLRLSAAGGRRAIILVLVSVAVALMTMDWARAPVVDLEIGDVAPRTISAPYDFNYQDQGARTRDQEVARSDVPPVLLADQDLAQRLDERIETAFAAARSALEVEEGLEPTDAQREEAMDAFRDRLSRHLPSSILEPLARTGFSSEAAQVTRELLAVGTAGYVIGDRDALPAEPGTAVIVDRADPDRLELDTIPITELLTPSEARQAVSMRLLDQRPDAPWSEAVGTVARALVQANVEYDSAETEARRERAAAATPVRTVTVQRGTTLFRKGDPITPLHRLQYREMLKSHTDQGRFARVIGTTLLIGFLLSALFAFGTSSLRRFSTEPRDVGSAGLLIVLVSAIGAVVSWLAPPVAQLLGSGATPGSFFWLIPVAGAGMLVRLLVGRDWAIPFNAAASLCVVLVVGGGIVEFSYFMASSSVAAGAVHHTRERMAILRAGLFTGTVNAVLALVVFYLLRTLSDAGMGDAGLGALVAMASGFAGGIASAFFVLGLTPLFESVGFVTDYRLMELANLNHPLMRQLMLRAPGSYHHSVVVGSLAEAGCEAIGANALLARVASYFHDIGKSLKPQYFVENQGDGGNRHDQLDPHTSAEVIIGHVLEGGRMAKEHNLPQPVIDNIYMHHGTGLLSYFMRQAREQADDPDTIDEARFRYPGPKPSTREAGVIMLADKIEAATRTIKQPNEENIRAMIGRIVDSVMADGQFNECPLTMAEISVVLDTFVKTLLGIYHHRIEYADTASISQAETPARVIALPRRPDANADSNTDYESVEYLPR